MTRYQFRVHSANVLFTILVFAVMAFGAVERWALTFVEVSIMLLALVWVVRRAFRPFPLEGNVFAWPLIGIVLMAVLQSVMGWSAAPYQTSGEALKWTALLAYFLMWAHVFRDESTRSRFSLLLTWFGFLVAVLALVQFYSSPDLLYWFRPAPTAQPFGPFVDRNHYAVLMELVLPGALLFAFSSITRSKPTAFQAVSFKRVWMTIGGWANIGEGRTRSTTSNITWSGSRNIATRCCGAGWRSGHGT